MREADRQGIGEFFVISSFFSFLLSYFPSPLAVLIRPRRLAALARYLLPPRASPPLRPGPSTAVSPARTTSLVSAPRRAVFAPRGVVVSRPQPVFGPHCIVWRLAAPFHPRRALFAPSSRPVSPSLRPVGRSEPAPPSVCPAPPRPSVRAPCCAPFAPR
ncbi:hypothetical protein DENSPDRAFT_840586, partial [Dentipellis sp. KUC8613]